jgi:hypothetical protein
MNGYNKSLRNRRDALGLRTIECVGSPRYLVVSSKRVAIVCRSPLRCEAHRPKLGPHQDPDHARIRMLPFAWTGFEKPPLIWIARQPLTVQGCGARRFITAGRS